MRTLTAPFREHESVLRAYFAQAPDHSFVATNTVNLVDVYGSSGTADVHIEGRDLEGESESEKERFILQLDPKIRRKHGELVVVPTLKDFKTNFGVFTEGALLDLGMFIAL